MNSVRLQKRLVAAWNVVIHPSILLLTRRKSFCSVALTGCASAVFADRPQSASGTQVATRLVNHHPQMRGVANRANVLGVRDELMVGGVSPILEGPDGDRPPHRSEGEP